MGGLISSTVDEVALVALGVEREIEEESEEKKNNTALCIMYPVICKGFPNAAAVHLWLCTVYGEMDDAQSAQV